MAATDSVNIGGKTLEELITILFDHSRRIGPLSRLCVRACDSKVVVKIIRDDDKHGLRRLATGNVR